MSYDTEPCIVCLALKARAHQVTEKNPDQRNEQTWIDWYVSDQSAADVQLIPIAACDKHEVELAASLLRKRDSECVIQCRECGQTFAQIFGETACMYCREGIERV